MNPTKTTNKIHFEDLDWTRFEDLCLNLIYRLKKWFEINHYGRLGKDDGIDIHALEKLDNKSINEWIIQVKRYKKMDKTHLIKVIDTIIEKNEQTPNTLLLIVSCDISKNNIEVFKEHARQKGIDRAIIWTASILETKLYSDYNDLLFAYFGISLTSNRPKEVLIENLKKELINNIKALAYKTEDIILPCIYLSRNARKKITGDLSDQSILEEDDVRQLAIFWTMFGKCTKNISTRYIEKTIDDGLFLTYDYNLNRLIGTDIDKALRILLDVIYNLHSLEELSDSLEKEQYEMLEYTSRSKRKISIDNLKIVPPLHIHDRYKTVLKLCKYVYDNIEGRRSKLTNLILHDKSPFIKNAESLSAECISNKEIIEWINTREFTYWLEN